MRLTGLITEYNPFHNGHLYHLKETIAKTDATHTVAVMSGHFLQRGEVALLDKWQRAEMAVRSGVDLVVELPSVYASSSAEHFARGAVLSLSALGCSAFCFGSEAGELTPLLSVAEALAKESEAFKSHLKSQLKTGQSYPTARQFALEQTVEHFPSYDANNILGIEYLKALLQTQSSMAPFTIQRIGSAYNDEELKSHISSATAIRKSLRGKDARIEAIQHSVPASTYAALERAWNDKALVHQEALYPLIKYQLLTESDDVLSSFHDMAEGLHNRLKQSALKAYSLLDLIERTKTKRYTQTRIQRALINMLLKRNKELMNRLLFTPQVPYLRVLAFNQKGKEIIRFSTKEKEAPLMTNPSRFPKWTEESRLFFNEDIKSTNLFRLIQGKQLAGEDYTTRPIEIS